VEAYEELVSLGVSEEIIAQKLGGVNAITRAKRLLSEKAKPIPPVIEGKAEVLDVDDPRHPDYIFTAAPPGDVP
jgi:hypothetical protein